MARYAESVIELIGGTPLVRLRRLSAGLAPTVLAKLEWYRLGDEVSDRQWRDVLGIFKLQQGRLNRDYMKKWAEELKVSDLLERAIREAI